MAGQKHLPHGTAVSFSSADIKGLRLVSLPDRSKGEAETTDHDSAFDREYIPGLRDGGTVNLEMRRIDGDTGQAALITNYEADRAIEECVITLPPEATDDSTVVTYTFDSFVTNVDGDDQPADEDEAAIMSASIRVTGAVTKATA